MALFNILQEGDIQIRGFKLRLPLDIQFVFTANPEDYTNRGSIVTPLKDRIDSQIITHYPKTLEIGKTITQQEARINASQRSSVTTLEIAKDLVEQIAFEARKSEYVDAKSGVSARLTISAYESLIAGAERRNIINNEKTTTLRMSDFVGVIPSITGKVELVYEGEQEGPGIVAQNLVGKAIRAQFVNYFPDPDKFRKQKEKSPYRKITNWFGEGNTVDILHDLNNADYEAALKKVPGLADLVNEFHKGKDSAVRFFLMEFALHGLSEYSLLSKHSLTAGLQFKDLLSSMFTLPKPGGDDDEADLEDDEPLGGPSHTIIFSFTARKKTMNPSEAAVVDEKQLSDLRKLIARGEGLHLNSSERLLIPTRWRGSSSRLPIPTAAHCSSASMTTARWRVYTTPKRRHWRYGNAWRPDAGHRWSFRKPSFLSPAKNLSCGSMWSGRTPAVLFSRRPRKLRAHK